tara:strand:+ start:2174 stop:2467 length:294 start_codon:yes stop_codon:yes gene_type:complete
MEIKMIPDSDENGGGYLPHMSEWFAIDIQLVDGPLLRSMVTHPAGVISLLHSLAPRTDVEDCKVLVWNAATGKYDNFQLHLGTPMVAHSFTPWEVVA